MLVCGMQNRSRNKSNNNFLKLTNKTKACRFKGAELIEDHIDNNFILWCHKNCLDTADIK